MLPSKFGDPKFLKQEPHIVRSVFDYGAKVRIKGRQSTGPRQSIPHSTKFVQGT